MPLQFKSWDEALILFFRGAVDIVSCYENWFVHSAHAAHQVPAVLVLKSRIDYKPELAFTRNNIYFRDGHICQYCGKRQAKSRLTFDHVHPKSRGGKTNWENIVTCCHPCNRRKADMFPMEADMPLRRIPREPSAYDAFKFKLLETSIQDEWKPYLKHFTKDK